MDSTRKTRIGLVGAGWWAAANHLPHLKSNPNVDLVGVCRFGSRELEKVRSAFDIPFATEHFEELLDRVPMDGLVIASPHEAHGRQALAAIERGIHVLIEKPMSIDVNEARRIVERAAAKRLHVLVPFGWNFKPFVATARKMIAAGKIGSIRHLSGVMASPIGELMSGAAMPGTEAEMFRPDPAMWANAKTGGYGFGQLVHLLGAVFYLTDLAPKEVFALTGLSETGSDIFNAVSLRFQNQATGALSGAATVPQECPFQIDIRLFGDRGMLLVDFERERLSLRRFDGEKLDVPIAPGEGTYECLEPLDRFVSLCAGEKVVNCGNAVVGSRSIEVVSAMLRSARSRALEQV